MFKDEIRRAAEAAARDELPTVAATLWRAFGEGHLTEVEAEEIAGLIEARQTLRTSDRESGSPNDPVASVKRRSAVGSRPRTDASMERRRRWAASGRLPPQVACKFTLAEVAVLAVVAVETIKRGDCRLYHEQIAAMAGVSRSTVRATMRRARDLGIVTIEERRSSAWRNLSSIVQIVSREWTAWNRLARRSPFERGGDKSPTTTNTCSSNLGIRRETGPSQRLPETGGRPKPKRTIWNRGAR